MKDAYEFNFFQILLPFKHAFMHLSFTAIMFMPTQFKYAVWKLLKKKYHDHTFYKMPTA